MKHKIGLKLYKGSIRVKLTLTLVIVITATIGILWMLNRTFLEEYYIRSKISTLGKTYTDIKEIIKDVNDEGELAEEAQLTLEKYYENRNVDIFAFARTKWFDQYTWISPMDSNGTFSQRYSDLRNSINALDNNSIIKSTKDYNVYIAHDFRLDTNYLALLEMPDKDKESIVFLRTNLDSMQESVKVANRFLAYVGIGSVLISVLIMLWISRKFTDPILQLAGIAKKIGDLDFDVKYQVKSKDELGELGSSINNLSEKLESTISELKRANNELLSDIENKVQIDEMRKDFLSNVTHELKTPIALIQGYAEGLKDNITEDEDSRDFYCEVIIDEALKMNTMVKKLLSLNQIEFGNNQPDINRFDLTALVTSVLHSTEILMEQRKVTLHFEQNEPLYVWADEYMIEEVMTNYISNALNHVDGQRIIEVKFILGEGVVRVAVFNTGMPIPEEDIENIWIKFYKVDKARTREYGGSGIGLSIVKAIMDSHNRKCGVINHENGVEFWIELDTTVQ